MNAITTAANVLTLLQMLCYQASTQNTDVVYPGCPCSYELQLSCNCYDGMTTVTPTCPSNYYFNEDDCQCCCNGFATCPEFYKWDSTQCGCFCDPDITCPEHYAWDVSECKCVCNRLCAKGRVLNNESCTCECENSCNVCELQNPSTCECETLW